MGICKYSYQSTPFIDQRKKEYLQSKTYPFWRKYPRLGGPGTPPIFDKNHPISLFFCFFFGKCMRTNYIGWPPRWTIRLDQGDFWMFSMKNWGALNQSRHENAPSSLHVHTYTSGHRGQLPTLWTCMPVLRIWLVHTDPRWTSWPTNWRSESAEGSILRENYDETQLVVESGVPA